MAYKETKITTRKYYKVYEYTSSGTYTLTIPRECNAEIIMVGGGGGGTYASSWITDMGGSSQSNTGGSAGLITGTTSISAGSYTIVVGAAGTGQSKSVIDNTATSNGTVGGNTTFNGNIAAGGGGAYSTAWYTSHNGTNGSAGTTTVVSTGLTGTDGIAGSTISRYLTYGGGGASGANGQSGYFKIIFESTSADYDYYGDSHVCTTYKTNGIYSALRC